jgi:hypothetical protein
MIKPEPRIGLGRRGWMPVQLAAPAEDYPPGARLARDGMLQIGCYLRGF